MPDDVRRLLERHRVSLCLHDMRGSATGRERVGPFVYVRFHGASGSTAAAIRTTRLRGLGRVAERATRRGADVYAYFNNDVGGHAPRDAVTLRRVLED